MSMESQVTNNPGQRATMDVLDAIRTRRSIGRVKSDPVDRAIIEELLEAASWAPNHFNSQPWRFIVMTGEGRSVLGEGYANVAKAGWPEMGSEELEEKLQKERAKAYRSPVVIAAIYSKSDDARAVYAEELAASQAAVQNLLLAAHAHGLGAIWRSGELMFNPLMRSALGLTEGQEEIVALIYLGYPDMAPPTQKRASIEEKSVWLEG
ncbi:nitroreductase [Paenibacillus sp. LHD-117]|uniref:nitroreductase family protein n=1 Tax=Paenibacillus sp. LHD-117 TaxID=3071412 RepID=UPI0027E20A7F|nr:nitroreductase [Paenibacillus sp. LHD-117]MDQ6422552.1 nitroreductase [Paenibacillus sp. LHD-117]